MCVMVCVVLGEGALPRPAQHVLMHRSPMRLCKAGSDATHAHLTLRWEESPPDRASALRPGGRRLDGLGAAAD